MRIRILGSAAGGGVPQWNCNCRNCSGVREGTAAVRPRTQSSVAVQGTDGDAWVLINASPDILAQLRAHPDLQPARQLRDTALGAIVLTDAQIDHTVGLLMLREAQTPWRLWCTDSVAEDLTQSHRVLPVLESYCGIQRKTIPLHGSFEPLVAASLTIDAVPVAGKPPPFSPHRDHPRTGDNIAFFFRSRNREVFYAPGLREIDASTWDRVSRTQCVLIDGTFWSDDELPSQGIGARTARQMGHLPLTGAGGMIEWLVRLPAHIRKVLVHINNTNPILDARSPERAQLEKQGIEVAFDGMEIAL